MGGLDWSGLELMTEVYGIDDIEDLIERLHLIKNYRPHATED